MIELLDRWHRLDSHECHYNEFHDLFEVRLYNGALYSVRFPLDSQTRYVILGAAQDWCENRGWLWEVEYNAFPVNYTARVDSRPVDDNPEACWSFDSQASAAEALLSAYLKVLEVVG